MTVVTDASESLSAAFRQNELDVAVTVSTAEDSLAAESWSVALRWYGSPRDMTSPELPLPLAVPPKGSALHEAATGALRREGRKFEIVCTSADSTVRAAAAAAGLAIVPMVERFAPEGLSPLTAARLPHLPSAALCLYVRPKPLVDAARQWANEAIEASS